MRDSLKRLIEETGGVVLLDGTLIQFSEQAFERMFQLVYEAGMESALAAATKQLDNLSES
jgi:hypothetical protein